MNKITAEPWKVGIAAEEALKAIRQRSFADRHPELGKMINCPVCDLRHRESIKCEQKFAKDSEGEDFTSIPSLNPLKAHKAILGAAAFAKKRKNPHLSKRNQQFVALVRKLVPEEFTEEELKDARELAKEILGWNEKKTWGLWNKEAAAAKKERKANARKRRAARNTAASANAETAVSPATHD
jgi:hypothetical protein